MKIGEFQKLHSLEKRIAESEKIRSKHPTRIPIIIESNTLEIDKCKYLVPNDLTIGQFLFVLRKRITISPEKAIYLFVDNTLPMTSAMISRIYDDYKDGDGFLYIAISSENTFG